MIWAKEETLSRDEMSAVQLAHLQKTVQLVYDKVPCYHNKMKEANLVPSDIKTLDDLRKLPFTTKQDLRDTYPYGMFAVPMDDVRRVHASSGTTGKPTVVGYTENDLKMWSENVARIVIMGGATKKDICQICFGYGMFTGALGLHYGLEHIGATVCPTSSGNTEKQIMYMKDFKTTLLVATPSYALRIAEVAYEMGIDPKMDLSIKYAVLGSELMTEAMRSEIYRLWGEDVVVTQNYGMSELVGPGVAGECMHLNGMHVNEDHFIPEIINPKTGEVLPPGERGELVVSCVTKEALPLIRYRTRDITSLMYEKCACGRTTVRLSNFTGRTDDMLKIRGVNIFPSQIEEILLSIDEIGPNYEIIVDRKNHTDTLEIRVEVVPDKLIDSYKMLEDLEKKVRNRLKVVLGIETKITLESPNTLQRFEGKAKRVTDLRKQ